MKGELPGVFRGNRDGWDELLEQAPRVVDTDEIEKRRTTLTGLG